MSEVELPEQRKKKKRKIIDSNACLLFKRRQKRLLASAICFGGNKIDDEMGMGWESKRAF